jgi:hypothetical protein
MPDMELVRKAETGCVILGGCLVGDADPTFRCKDCGTAFG